MLNIIGIAVPLSNLLEYLSYVILDVFKEEILKK